LRGIAVWILGKRFPVSSARKPPHRSLPLELVIRVTFLRPSILVTHNFAISPVVRFMFPPRIRKCPPHSNRAETAGNFRFTTDQSSRWAIGQLIEKPLLPNLLPPGPVMRPSCTKVESGTLLVPGHGILD
jgi:hypothetical protein